MIEVSYSVLQGALFSAMICQMFPLKCLLLNFLIYSINLNVAVAMAFPRLNPTEKIMTHVPEAMATNDSGDIETFYYKQTLDHFNYMPESYTTFDQRYMINSKYWGGANSSSPIFVYLGAEAPIDGYPHSVGFMIDNAASFNALLVYIEHRYYGKSVPFGSREEALKNASTIGYFNSAQAIADYAEIILHIKETLDSQKSPVIVIGGSYGGMLASWFRLKYPHISLGALASSAPILYFDDITPQNSFYSIITKGFREASETCYETILNSWSEIDRVASEPNGLSILSQRFNTCHPLSNLSELKAYLESIYVNASQYNYPPRYPITVICAGIDGASFGSDILSKIYSGVVAFDGNSSCKVNAPKNISETIEGWRWQSCSEMVMPIRRGNDTMFPSEYLNTTSFIEYCRSKYGVLPRPRWVTSYYGGPNLKRVLRRFGSNIIFSNGLKDPFSGGGVLESVSDSIVAVYTTNGSHCLDIRRSNESDPEWLVNQREEEVQIVKGWITQYYADLNSTSSSSKLSIQCYSVFFFLLFSWNIYIL